MRCLGTRRELLRTAATAAGATCLGARLVDAAATTDEIARVRAELSLEFQRRQLSDRMVLFRKLVAKYGDGLIRDVELNTIEETRSRLEKADLETRDLTGVKRYLWDHLGEGFEFVCLEDHPTRLAYKVTRCFLAEEVAKFGQSRLGFAFYCAWDVGFCQGLNPRITFTRTQTLMAGDPCCNHAYQLPAAVE